MPNDAEKNRRPNGIYTASDSLLSFGTGFATQLHALFLLFALPACQAKTKIAHSFRSFSPLAYSLVYRKHQYPAHATMTQTPLFSPDEESESNEEKATAATALRLPGYSRVVRPSRRG